MMKHIVNTTLLLLALLLPATVLAHDFEVDGIYYNINGNEATVTYKGQNGWSEQSYSGDVTIPSTVTYNVTTYLVTAIGNYAFYNCTSLTSIDIPNSVTSIGVAAFNGCSGLASVTIPNSVTFIGNSVFSDCISLTSIDIPNSVTAIVNYAFSNCTSLTSIDIPNSVTTIGNHAFWCTALTSIDIPNSVTTIGDYAFDGCSLASVVTIGNSVTTIGYRAFSNCSLLTSIDIPNSVTNIDYEAFLGCSSLAKITVASDNPFYDSRNNCNAIIETAGNTLITGCINTVIPNSVTTIGNGAFSDCTSLTTIDIPNSVTSIGYDAFICCFSLTNIDIPNSVTNIGDEAFSGCYSLTSIDIPNSLMNIGNEVFYGCSSLTSIDIPNSLTNIGNYVFEFCSSLNDVYSYITDPSEVTMGSDVFYRSPNNYGARTLHVPFGTLAAYQADTRWSEYFGSIVEMEPEPVLAEAIKLNVTTAGLNEGSTLQLTATVLPEECDNKTVLWSSNDPSVATVDSNGLVTTHSVGTTTITAVTTDGSNLNASCTVTLLPVGVKGDMNGDGRVTITDVTSLIDYLLSGLTW